MDGQELRHSAIQKDRDATSEYGGAQLRAHDIEAARDYLKSALPTREAYLTLFATIPSAHPRKVDIERSRTVSLPLPTTVRPIDLHDGSSREVVATVTNQYDNLSDDPSGEDWPMPGSVNISFWIKADPRENLEGPYAGQVVNLSEGSDTDSDDDVFGIFIRDETFHKDKVEFMDPEARLKIPVELRPADTPLEGHLELEAHLVEIDVEEMRQTLKLLGPEIEFEGLNEFVQ